MQEQNSDAYADELNVAWLVDQLGRGGVQKIIQRQRGTLDQFQDAEPLWWLDQLQAFISEDLDGAQMQEFAQWQVAIVLGEELFQQILNTLSFTGRKLSSYGEKIKQERVLLHSILSKVPGGNVEEGVPVCEVVIPLPEWFDQTSDSLMEASGHVHVRGKDRYFPLPDIFFLMCPDWETKKLESYRIFSWSLRQTALRKMTLSGDEIRAKGELRYVHYLRKEDTAKLWRFMAERGFLDLQYWGLENPQINGQNYQKAIRSHPRANKLTQAVYDCLISLGTEHWAVELACWVANPENISFLSKDGYAIPYERFLNLFIFHDRFLRSKWLNEARKVLRSYFINGEGEMNPTNTDPTVGSFIPLQIAIEYIVLASRSGVQLDMEYVLQHS